MPTKTSSDFHYKLRVVWSGETFVVIQDKNRGGRSVTNDIENVIDFIVEEKNLSKNAKNVFYIYKDSTGVWDGYDPAKGEFVPLQCQSENEAINKYLKKIH